MNLLVRRLDPDLPLPSYAHPGDAGLDLVAREAAVLAARGGRAMVPTGIAVAIPEGYGGFVQPRSGLAAKHGVTVLNSPGLVDAGYRDEVRVVLVNHGAEDYAVSRGDRIAQLVILAVAQASIEVVEDLPEATRNAGGFGSTGR